MTAVPISGIERFVSPAAAAEFLQISRRRLLQLARNREIPAHPIGSGRRKTWRFRLSEIADAISTENLTSAAPKPDIIGVGSPRSRRG